LKVKIKVPKFIKRKQANYFTINTFESIKILYISNKNIKLFLKTG